MCQKNNNEATFAPCGGAELYDASSFCTRHKQWCCLYMGWQYKTAAAGN